MKNYCFCLILLFFSIFLMACSDSDDHEAQGYIEGRYTYIATPVSGVLKEILVKRGTYVKAGQVLFSLEAQPEINAYESAKEQRAAAVAERDTVSANLIFAKQTYERNKTLVPKRAIQQSQLDQSEANLKALQAQLKVAEAKIKMADESVKQARWLLNQKTVVAPIGSLVFDTFYRMGEYTEANHAIISLLAPTDVRAIFYVPEPHLAVIKLGDEIEVMCDQCDRVYTGKISFISPTAEFTPPVIFSNDTNEKLVFRIEADFSNHDAMKLHPGQPIQVVYDIDDE